MMNEFKRWSKSYLLLLATYDKILSWLIEIWMKKYLVSNSNCKYNPPKIITRNDKLGGVSEWLE
jgi:hypothetical protein